VTKELPNSTLAISSLVLLRSFHVTSTYQCQHPAFMAFSLMIGLSKKYLFVSWRLPNLAPSLQKDQQGYTNKGHIEDLPP